MSSCSDATACVSTLRRWVKDASSSKHCSACCVCAAATAATVPCMCCSSTPCTCDSSSCIRVSLLFTSSLMRIRDVLSSSRAFSCSSFKSFNSLHTALILAEYFLSSCVLTACSCPFNSAKRMFCAVISSSLCIIKACSARLSASLMIFCMCSSLDCVFITCKLYCS